MNSLSKKIHASFLGGEKFRHVYLFPIIFLFLFLAINYRHFTSNYQEMGDLAVNAIQVERAAQFQETLGPYSRGEFNHPGPISFYYYALTEPALFFIKSPYARHILAQVFLNFLFFIASLNILYRLINNKRHIYIFGLSFLFALSPMGARIIMNIWGPALLIFPMLLFMIACAGIALGGFRILPALTISAVFMVQNHVGSLALITPLSIIAFVLFYRNRDKTMSLISRKNLTYLGISLAILFITSLPPLIQEFSSSEGNISKIMKFILFRRASRRVDMSFNFIFSYYANPLKPLFSLPPVLAVALLFGLGLPHLKKKSSFYRYLYLFTGAALVFSVLSANRIVGGLAPFLFWYEYACVGLIFFLALLTLISLIPSLSIEPRSAFRFGLIMFVLSLGLLYKIKTPEYNDTVEKLMMAVKPEKNRVYELYWKIGSRDHGQWVAASGFALRMTRAGFTVCVPREWEFLLPVNFSCRDKKNIVRLNFHTIQDVPRLKRIKKNAIQYRTTEIVIQPSSRKD